MSDKIVRYDFPFRVLEWEHGHAFYLEQMTRNGWVVIGTYEDSEGAEEEIPFLLRVLRNHHNMLNLENLEEAGKEEGSKREEGDYTPERGDVVYVRDDPDEDWRGPFIYQRCDGEDPFPYWVRVNEDSAWDECFSEVKLA